MAGVERGAAAETRDRLVPEGAGKHRHVLRPLAQRRHHDADDVEAIQQIFAKPPRVRFVAQRTIRGRDDPGIDAPRQVFADAARLAVLDDAQQLRLSARRQLADLVEEQRAAIGFLEQPGAFGQRAGEGAARVAEELGLEQFVGERGAVDGAEPAMTPRPMLMQRPRDQLLAAAALPFDQHMEGSR